MNIESILATYLENKYCPSICKHDDCISIVLGAYFHDYPCSINITKKSILMLEKIDTNVSISINCKGHDRKLHGVFSRIPKNLPNNITSLIIRDGNFDEIPVLPDSIKKLIIENCQVKKLPSKWPNKLKQLSLYRNHIEEFPKNLPKSLKYLFLKENPITKIGVLHEGLEDLDISYTNIDQLSDLPKSLEYLRVYGSDIKKPDNTEWKNGDNLEEYKKLNEDEEKLDAFIDEIMLDEKKLQKLIQKIESQKKQLN